MREPRVPLTPVRAGPLILAWGERTYVMAIVNATPDSFSGDGVLVGERGRPAPPDIAAMQAVAMARRAVEEGADLVDVGGESTRPGHVAVDVEEEVRRVVPIVTEIHRALPAVPISIDTTKPAVAEAALSAGAVMVNDVRGVAAAPDMLRVIAERGVPYVVMHNREEPRYRDLLAEILDDLRRALDRALAAGVAWESLIVDPGFGFGKTPRHNLALLRGLGRLRELGRPVLLGTSRKSTLGRVLDLPPSERLEATLVTTALGVAAGVDIVRVHDVRANVRAARMADAIVRGWSEPPEGGG